MKKTIKVYSLLFALCVSFSFVSCDKDKHEVRKNIDGTWNVIKVTSNGKQVYQSVTGTYTFGECSRKENRKFSCSIDIDLTLTLDGEIGTSSSSTNYQVLKKGKKIMLDDAEFEIDLQGDAMTMTNRDGGVVLVIELIR